MRDRIKDRLCRMLEADGDSIRLRNLYYRAIDRWQEDTGSTFIWVD